MNSDNIKIQLHVSCLISSTFNSFSVFETLFYGDMADKNKYIRIPDVAPIGFENLLRYAYTDSLNLGSVEDAMLTAYAAKKYLLPQLLRECLTYIEQNISPSTACVVFEFAQVLNSQQLVLQAMNLIDRQTSSVIAKKSFASAQASTVEFLTNRKYLSINSEYSLFIAVLNWSIAECKRKNLDESDWLEVRAIMSENALLKGFRFLAMTQEEFARAVSKSSSLVEVQTSNHHASSSKENPEDANETVPDQAHDSAGVLSSISKVNTESTNSLLTDAEQRAIFLNLALQNSAKLPSTVNPATIAREPPPEYFTLRRYKTSQANMVTTVTTTRNINLVHSKFQCLNENIFIVGLTIPIRLDASSYVNRTPKFECYLRFTTKPASTVGRASSPVTSSESPTNGHHLSKDPGSLDGSTMLMDTLDESLHISISRDKDCLVRMKRPILIRMGSINEISISFQNYALDEDIALRTPRPRSTNLNDQTDGENIDWLFYKTSSVEFSELHYYY